MSHDHLQLADAWRFCPDPVAEGEAARWYEDDFDDARWLLTSLPGLFDRIDSSLAGYEGHGWFRRPLDVPGA